MAVQLIVAESSELFQMGVTAMLEKTTSVNLLGFANDNDELVGLLKSQTPEVILFDYTSKNFSLDVVPRVQLSCPNARFVGITGEKSGGIVMKGIRHGIKSYVKKECSGSEIIEAIVETAAGKKFFCGELLEQMRNENVNIENIEDEALSCEPVSLSDRELEIIKLIAEGYSNAQIAVVLYISNHTVNTHRKNIMKKLGVNNTAAIVMFAVKSGLVIPDQVAGIPELG